MKLIRSVAWPNGPLVKEVAFPLRAQIRQVMDKNMMDDLIEAAYDEVSTNEKP